MVAVEAAAAVAVASTEEGEAAAVVVVVETAAAVMAVVPEADLETGNARCLIAETRTLPGGTSVIAVRSPNQMVLVTETAMEVVTEADAEVVAVVDMTAEVEEDLTVVDAVVDVEAPEVSAAVQVAAEEGSTVEA